MKPKKIMRDDSLIVKVVFIMAILVFSFVILFLMEYSS